jgi:hypothetical protein
MLDIGFYDDIMEIISYLPKERQTLMFSATFPKEVEKLARQVLCNPAEVKIAVSKPAEGITQSVYILHEEQKLPLLLQITDNRVQSTDNSQFYRQKLKDLRFSTLNSQFFYDWYRASTNEQIEGIYPSVVSTWQAMQWIADMGGGRFDFMGAGPRNKEYGVRNFKLKFGGELIPEYRYRKCLMK